jgi:pSer/pThr/pTyr-binding forkhead associated (FHA) protein
MNVELVVIGGAKAGMEIRLLSPRFLIGRGDECQLRPRCRLVSQRHCAISADKDSAIIEDYGSAPGLTHRF